MRKAAVRHGDGTTTKGIVIALSSTIFDDGKRVALTGDMATCGHCKGMFKLYGTGQGISEKGRDAVVDGDLVLCPCGKNRVIVGANPGIFLDSSGSTEAASAGNAAQSMVTHSIAALVHDERVQVVGSGASEGYPYFIETADGRTFSGRIGSGGKLPRIETAAGASDYTIHWGDEALAQPGFSDR